MEEKFIGENLIDFYRRTLLEEIIPWWETRFIDRESGGFFACFDADGSLIGTDKPVWGLARIIWMWSRLYNTCEKREDWLYIAKHGLAFLLKHAFDSDGRMFYSLTREGKPLRKRRYLYSEAFGVIALAEYAKASGSEEIMQKAKGLYRLLLRYHDNPELLPPKIFPQTRRCKALGMPMILIATSQIMQEVDTDGLYADVIGRFKVEIIEDFLKTEKKCVLETVHHDGEILDTPEGRTVNPGHSIETSWFLLEEARRSGEHQLLELASRMLEWSLEIGWDCEHGGLLYFVDCDGKPPDAYEHELKLWWPHTEAMYACLLAYYLTRDVKWEIWHNRLHAWSFSHFPDKIHGEWFGYLRKDGTVSNRMKGNMWKGPFHLPRFLLYSCNLLAEMKIEAGNP